jgi:hypothetical protein
VAAVDLQHVERLAEQQLPVARAIGRGQQIGHRHRHKAPHRRDKAPGRHRTAQGDMGDPPVGGQQPPVSHGPSKPGNASNSARAPCPMPPRGRAASPSGDQP